MKILITGSKGMLGQDIVKELKKTKFEIFDFGKEKLDITNKSDMNIIKKISPNFIINCAAYTKVDLAEKEKEKCYSDNVKGVKEIVDICKRKNFTLVHISTDYVFDGTKKEYNENDKKNPINYYGKTKAESEDIIINNLKKYYIIRTSWLFGKNENNFVEKFLRFSKGKKELKVVNDQFGSPTYTKDLSRAIIKVIDKKYGIYHITNSGNCSWFEFASEIVKKKNIKCKLISCSTKEFPTKAKRPRYSILKNNKIKKLRLWKLALNEYLKEK
ncbi:MAG: dTDP-4-dehydrorhamnose reductase [Nanoarchaeota archaeon]|nr:dTDP-4-dehydrorhamnose reductase [Nanoarchaeota archaeon]MBU1854516.1 dTDP-4-dehydrorhamnose reductase [Nanoarchaeota archaeon]